VYQVETGVCAQAGIVLGFEEGFSAWDLLRLPVDMVRVHLWERVSLGWFALPAVVGLATGYALEKRPGSSFDAPELFAVAAIASFAATSANVVAQALAALSWSDVHRDEWWISLLFALGHLVFVITPALELARKGGVAHTTLTAFHFVGGVGSFFLFGAGFYVGGVCLLGLGVTNSFTK
jgi:hypothetical protein